VTQRVLFVDDMPDMGALIVDLLQLEGMQADWCGAGDEAATRLRSRRYCVLVTDLCLGGAIDGEALVVIARELGLPALVVSGDADAIQRLQAEGVDAVLKPLDVQHLIGWLRGRMPSASTVANG